MEFDGIDAMHKPVVAFQDRLMLVGEVGMLLPFGLPRGSAQSRGSPGNPAGPLARDRLVQDSVASEDVHADKEARLVHDLVPGRRVDLRLSGHVRVLGRSFDRRAIYGADPIAYWPKLC